MLMFIIGMSLLFSYVMSYLHISQSAAQWIVAMHLSKWLLLAAILLMVVVLGFFLPPVSIILMTAPIILPPLKAAGFDLIWFGVLMTIVMEMGLIHPPVGLNLFVIKNIAPDIPLRDVVWGVLPFVGLMFVAIVLICIFPGIATAFPNSVMGAPKQCAGAGGGEGGSGGGRSGSQDSMTHSYAFIASSARGARGGRSVEYRIGIRHIHSGSCREGRGTGNWEGGEDGGWFLQSGESIFRGGEEEDGPGEV